MDFAVQNPGAKEKNNSFILLKNSPTMGNIIILPPAFITANPSILFFARALMNKPDIGASNDASKEIAIIFLYPNHLYQKTTLQIQ